MKLLVVEDEVEIAGALGDYGKSRGYEVFTAHDGLSALELAQAQRPDVILLDISMPGLDGRDVLARLKQDGLIERSVVLFVTAHDGQHERVLGLTLGADDYEVKPIHFQTLFNKIKRLLDKKRPSG